MRKLTLNNWQNLVQIWHGPPYSTFCEGIIHSTICEGIIFKFHPPEFVDDIIHSTICEGIIFKFHPLEFVDDIIHSTFCEGIIFQFHPQKNPKIQISKFQNSSCFQRVPSTSVPSPVHFPGFTLTWFDISRNWSQPLLPPTVFVTIFLGSTRVIQNNRVIIDVQVGCSTHSWFDDPCITFWHTLPPTTLSTTRRDWTHVSQIETPV